MEYRGGKRRVYAAAYQELMTTGMRRTDAYISMFVKQDKYCETDILSKMPRAIQYRSPRYNLMLASFLRPYEHVLYNKPGLGPTATRCITKGLNRSQIAELFLTKAAAFDNPLYISADHSKFDSTINETHLKFEHMLYDRTYKNSTLRKLLKHQLKNKCYTRSGIKYTIRGTRMSGDYNTGLGNSLINKIVLDSWVYGLKHEIMLDGDDSIIIIEASDLNKLNMNHFEKMGFITKMEFTDEITQVDYCQTRLVLGSTVTMCRNPWRALSHMAVTTKCYHPSVYRRWLGGVAECEASSNKGMPIYHALFDLVVNNSIRDEEWHRKMQNETVGISDTINRDGFAATFGISEQLQLAIEERVSIYTGYNFFKLFNTGKANRSKYDDERIQYWRQQAQSNIESTSGKFHSLDATTTPWWGTNGPGSMGSISNAGSIAGYGSITAAAQ
uniref:RNA-directed RNA polymerase n=1 Tax=Riboviria sp. TaxID=2585031 RepID=A0A8K1JGU7_9VIRU|nr:MAG: RNA-dependent RNA polymerase [Riboviria sp.]